MAASAGTAWVEIRPDMTGFNKELQDGADKASKGFGDSMKKALVGSLAAAGAAITVFAVKAVGDASDLQETMSKVNTVFGESADEIVAWSEDSASAMGLSQQAALDAAGGFGNMFSQIGFGTDVSKDMSTDLIQMAADLASFNNVQGGAAAVTDMMSAAMRGEYDSLQQVIPTINAAAVEQKALAQTGKDSAKELTAQEKAAATYALIMEDAGAAVGDFSRTSDGLANQQRILGANFENLSAKVGGALLPVVNAVVTGFNSYLIPAFEAVWAIIQDKVIPVVVDLYNQWWPVIQDIIGIVIDTLVPAFQSFAAYVTDELIPVLQGIWDTWAPIIQQVAGIILDTLLPPLQDVGRFIMDTVWPAVQDLASAFADKLGPALETVSGFFETIITWLLEHEGVVKTAAGVILVIFTPALLAMGIQATISFALLVAGWVASAAQAVVSVAKTIAQIAINIAYVAVMGAAYVVQFAIMAAQWVAGAAAATVNAAKIVAAWVVQKTQMLITVALAVVNFGILIAQWVALGVAALINAAIVAAGWLIAFWPVALIVAAIVAVIAIVWIFWDDIVKVLTMVKDFLFAVFSAIWDFIVGIWTTLFDTVKGLITAWIDFVLGIYKWLWDRIVQIFTAIKDAVVNIWNGLWNTVKGIIETMKGWISTAFNFIKDTITNVFNNVKNVVTGIWDGISNAIKTAIDKIKGFINGMWDVIKSVVNLAVSGLNVLIDGANSAIGLLNALPGPDLPKIPKIPKLAEGGIVTGPTLALIGEAGPEAVVPLNKDFGAGAKEQPIYLTVKIGDDDITDMIEEVTRKDQDALARMLVGGRRL